MDSPSFELQPTLEGSLLRLQPLRPDDFEALYACASDPRIWAQHPKSDRYQRPAFEEFFKSGIASGGAFLAIDRVTGEVMGSTRYYDLRADQKRVSIGYTFLACKYWGGRFNGEMKSLMLKHAFRFVDSAYFEVGETNIRSRRAMERIGGRLVGKMELEGKPYTLYRIDARPSSD